MLTSRSASELVGSSSTRTLAPSDTPRAMATICCCAVLSAPSVAPGSMASPSLPSSSPVSVFMRRQSTSPQRRGSRPRNTFSATER